MTKAEREACKAEFITGNYRTLAEYADAHGYSRRYIREIGAADKWLDDKAKHQRQIAGKLLAQDKKDATNTLTARREMMEDIKSTLLKRVQEKLSEATLTANEMNLLANAVVKIDTMDSGAIETADSEREALEKVVEALQGAICRDN